MSDSEAEAVMAAFLRAQDAADGPALDALLRTDAAFSRETQGALLELDRAGWIAFARARDPAGEGTRNALLIQRSPDAAAFKVDTRLPRATLTDRIVLRAGADGWRVASVCTTG